MKIDEKKMRIMWQITAVIYLICIGVLCFGRFESTPDVPRFLLGIPMDKIVHMIMFIPLPIISLYAFYREKGKLGSFVLFLVLMYLAGLMLAAGIEIGQMFTGYRSYELLDFVADTVGLVIGTFIIIIIKAFSKKW